MFKCPECGKGIESVGVKQTAYVRVHVDESGRPYEWDDTELTDEKPVDALCPYCDKDIAKSIKWD